MFVLHNTDCLALMAGMADNSVDLIATDPPYYKVKKDSWDNQWDSQDKFLEWLERCLREFVRILKPDGSLYMFTSPRLSSTIEAIVARHMQVENHIVWVKPFGPHLRQNRAVLRRFFPATERIIFASQKPPQRGVKRTLTDEKRPFDVAGREWFTDSWVCKPVGYYPGKHPCEKPLAMMEHIVTASTRPGALVFDPFMGSGTTGVAAIRTGRRFVGCELGTDIYRQAEERIRSPLGQKSKRP